MLFLYGKFSEVQSCTLSEVAAGCGSDVIASDSEVQNQGFELRTIFKRRKNVIALLIIINAEIYDFGNSRPIGQLTPRSGNSRHAVASNSAP